MEKVKSDSALELSVIVVTLAGRESLTHCLDALMNQVDAPKMEIIIPYDKKNSDILTLKSRYDKVYVIQNNSISNRHTLIQKHEPPNLLRARGIGAASGKIVALLEDSERPNKNWAREIIEIHKNRYTAVGGAIENEIDKPLNWAVYFCDFYRYHNPVKPGPSNYLSDVNVSYKRESLEKIQEVWQEAFHEPIIHEALRDRGGILWLSPKIIVYQHRKNLTLPSIIQERFVWGYYFSNNRFWDKSFIKPISYAILSPFLPLLVTIRQIHDILVKKRLVMKYFHIFPLTFFLTVVWSIGEFFGYLNSGLRHKNGKMN